MSDLLSEEETRAAFGALRAQELGQVRAPGVQAAHRTVRRRQAVRAVSIAGAVAVVAGGGFLLGQTIHTSPSTPAAQPGLEQPDQQAMGVIARDLIGLSTQTPDMISNSWGPLDTSIRDDDEAADFSAYTLKVACAGGGLIHVKLAVGSTSSAADATCGPGVRGAGGTSVTVDLKAPTDGTHGVSVLIEPDPTAQQNAGFAYSLTRS